MADPENDAFKAFDSALDQAGLSGTAPDATTQNDKAGDSLNNDDEGIEVGGRVWTSVEDLDKAWKSLQGDHTKKSQLLSEREKQFKSYQEEHKDAIEMATYFKNNPEIHDKVKDFFQRVTSGEETPKEAIKSSGLAKASPELKELLKWKTEVETERQDSIVAEADAVLDEEISDLRKEYKLSQEKVDQVLKEAYKFNKNVDDMEDWVPLKDVYLMLQSKHAWRKTAGKDPLPTPRSENVGSAPERRLMTPEDEFSKALDKLL